MLSGAAGGSYEEPKHTADVCYRGFQKKTKRFLWFLTPRGKMGNFVRNLQNTLQNVTNFWRAFLRFYSIWLKCKQIFDGLMMGFLHPKRGFRIWSKIEGYFWAHLVWAVLSPETPSILSMVTIRGFEALTGFFSVPGGKIEEKEKALPEPSCSRVFVLLL